MGPIMTLWTCDKPYMCVLTNTLEQVLVGGHSDLSLRQFHGGSIGSVPQGPETLPW